MPFLGCEMFQVVWSFVLHVFWCYPGSVVYIISTALSSLVSGLLPLSENTLILSEKGVKSGFHWLRATTSCLGKPRSVLRFTLLPFALSNTFLRILADPKRTHLWISSMDLSTPMVLRFSFNLSGTIPNAPTTMGITFVLTPHIFRISLARSWYFSSFSSYFALTLPSSGIATAIILLPKLGRGGMLLAPVVQILGIFRTTGNAGSSQNQLKKKVSGKHSR